MKTPQFLSLLLLQVFVNCTLAAAVSCAGADLSKLTSTVHVSPQGNDTAGCGSNPTSPCKTIQQGIANCRGEGCGVLVRYGTYNLAAPLQLVDGVSLYGSCIFDETAYRYRTAIIGRPAMRANGIQKPTVVYGFVISGSSGASAAEASFAMVVSNSTGLTLSHDVVASGRGAAGGNGNTGFAGAGEFGKYAPSDTIGGQGGRACTVSPPPGSAGKGGKGADFQQLHSSGCFLTCNCNNNNYPASIGKDGEKSGTVSGGGGGQRGTSGCACSNRSGGDAGGGPEGGKGNPGVCGTQGGVSNLDAKGSFAGTVWAPNRGGTGIEGQVGSGGGGGGSGGFGVVFPPTTDYPGYPGGGGGGGGCGGPGGTGGEQGGASIPLVLLNSSVAGLADANVLIPGPGGRGGNGATGARGGTGGQGASGRTGIRWQIGKAACSGTVPGFGGKGGNGGQGGAGAGGAGGNGGPSFGIALVSSPAFSAGGITIYPAQPGEGGTLGTGGQNDGFQCKGGDGQAGRSGFSNDANSIVSFDGASVHIGGGNE